MKRYGKLILFFVCLLVFMGVSGKRILKAEEKEVEKGIITGLAIEPYDNAGKAYENNWWCESELNIYVENVPVEIRKGLCEVTAFVPEGLKDGEYGLEFFFKLVNNFYSGQDVNYARFFMKAGKLQPESEGWTYEKVEGGYEIKFCVGYETDQATEEYQFEIKVHSENPEKNEKIYFTKMNFKEENWESTIVDFSERAIKVDARKFEGEGNVVAIKVDGTGIQLVESPSVMNQGDAVQLELLGSSFETVTCISSDEAVATVSKEGKLVATGAGKTRITLTNKERGTSYSWLLSVIKQDVPKLFSYGIAVSSYDNGGREYNDWWNDSELCAYVENINIGIIRGGYGVSAFIPDYTLKDGRYGVEVSLCRSRSPYDFFSYVGCELVIENGVLDEAASNGVFRRTEGGYLVDMASGYVLNQVVGDYVFVVKLHSTVSGENGSIYFGDLFFADASAGFQYIDLREPELKLSGERLSTGERVRINVAELSDELAINGLEALMYIGGKQKLDVLSSAAVTKLTYQSSNEAVAKITEDGMIAAQAEGEAWIMAKNSITGAECSARIIVKAPYVAPEIKKTAVLVNSSYQYVGVGYGVEAPDFKWISSNKTVGTIEFNTGLFKALKEGTTTITMLDRKSGKICSFVVEVYQVANSDLEQYITIETNGLISQELEQKVTKLLYEVYPEVFDYFANGKYEKVSCTFQEMDGVAYTTGNREMYISAEYLNAHPADVDCITHELIHCAQAYPGGDVWLIEGITDYGRSLIGRYNDEAGWSLATYAPGQSYTDSYGVTGGFLKYVVDNHNPNMVFLLNASLKNGFCPEKIWTENTGYTIDQLWEMYSKQ